MVMKLAALRILLDAAYFGAGILIAMWLTSCGQMREGVESLAQPAPAAVTETLAAPDPIREAIAEQVRAPFSP